jgi:hypothetical protein
MFLTMKNSNKNVQYEFGFVIDVDKKSKVLIDNGLGRWRAQNFLSLSVRETNNLFQELTYEQVPCKIR